MVNKTQSKQDLIREIEDALGAVAFGSVEIYVQDSKVTQITVRNIKKTSIDITESAKSIEKVQDPDRKVFTIHTHFRRTE
jgi:hypothetical protein